MLEFERQLRRTLTVKPTLVIRWIASVPGASAAAVKFWSSAISTYVTYPHAGDKAALLKGSVPTLSLDGRKVIVRSWLASLS